MEMPPTPALQRIVSLQPSVTAILAALGRLDRLVACTRYCADVCPEVAGLPVVADSWTAQAAEIAQFAPDIVIASVPYQPEALAEILRTGTRVLTLAPRTLRDIYGDIGTLAALVDARDRGAAHVREIQDELQCVRAATAKLPVQRIWCEMWGRPLMASQPWVAELVDAAGGTFIGDAGKAIEPDAVAAAAPDVIVAAWCGAGDRVPLDKIIRDRHWNTLPAARNGRVYCLPDEWLNTPGPTVMEGLRALAAVLHPDLFPMPPRVRRVAHV